MLLPSIVTGRTRTTQAALIPGFSDVPGSRGQPSSDTDYSQLKSLDLAIKDRA